MSDCLRRAACVVACTLLAAAAHAEKVPLTDDELGTVAGKGVAVLVHLELNSALLRGEAIDSRLSAGFTVDSVTTYAIAQNFGGVLDLFAITLDPSSRAGGPDYLAIGMPYYLGARQFGVRAIGVQTDASAPINGSLGSLLLNGTANMTGQLNLWPKTN
ncbi:MAG: hypothetical protein ABJD97_04765 [Betaproteobacteria bacterium]